MGRAATPFCTVPSQAAEMLLGGPVTGQIMALFVPLNSYCQHAACLLVTLPVVGQRTTAVPTYTLMATPSTTNTVLNGQLKQPSKFHQSVPVLSLHQHVPSCYQGTCCCFCFYFYCCSFLCYNPVNSNVDSGFFMACFPGTVASF